MLLYLGFNLTRLETNFVQYGARYGGSYMAELQAAIDDASRHLKGTGELLWFHTAWWSRCMHADRQSTNPHDCLFQTMTAKSAFCKH